MNQIEKNQLYSIAWFEDAMNINPQLVKAFQDLVDDETTRKTHLFEGRYENIYIDIERLPALQPVMDFLKQAAAEIMSVDKSNLGCGYWFNCMQPGDRTLTHTHNDDDEFLSAVYYLTVPEKSGYLVLENKDQRVEVQPESGKAVFFSPALPHEVLPNQSDQMRLSIGMNFGIRKP